MQYLILHKVRGEPAFDIAEKTMIGNEEGWVLCTCGHRAYPYKWWHLDDLVDTSDINAAGSHDRPATMDAIPDDWPEHYTVKREPKLDINKFLATLIKFKRRL